MDFSFIVEAETEEAKEKASRLEYSQAYEVYSDYQFADQAYQYDGDEPAVEPEQVIVNPSLIIDIPAPDPSVTED